MPEEQKPKYNRPSFTGRLASQAATVMEKAPEATDGIRPPVTGKGNKQGLAHLLRQPAIPTEWIIKDMIPRNELCAFIGEDGIGKTALMTELCANILFKAPHFLSPELEMTVKHGRALLISTEDSVQKFTYVMRLQIAGMFPSADQHKDVPDGFDFLDGENYNSWEEFTKGLDEEVPADHYDVVILDAIADVFTFIDGEINSNSDAAFLLKYLSHFCKEKKTTMIFLHHSSKSKLNEKKKVGNIFLEKDDTLGAGRLTAKSRTVLGLTHDHGSSTEDSDEDEGHLNFLHILKSNTAGPKWKKNAAALRFKGDTRLHGFIDKIRISRYQGNDEAASNMELLRGNTLYPVAVQAGMVPRNIVPMDITMEEHMLRVGRLFQVQDSFTEAEMVQGLGFEYKGWPEGGIITKLIPYLKQKKIIVFAEGVWILDAPPF